MGLSVARVALLLFASGSCALIYQTAWLRELRLVFGASTAASAAVLAVFMGGLGLGGLWLGRRADRHRRPLELYGNLELGIAVSAAATPLLIGLVRQAYIAAGGTQTLGMGAGTAVRLVLSAVVLGLPTFLMGGTLPAVAHAVETEGDVGRRRLAWLYGANTLGAVAGCLLATFALLEILGARRMLWTACAMNALIAMLARVWARQAGERPVADAAPVTAEPHEAPPAPAPLVLLAAGIVGFAFLLMELVWYRMLGPILGGSSYTFGMILAVALAGIGAGGIGYALFGQRAPTLGAFAVTAGLEALFIALPYALGDRVALWAALLRSLGALGFGGMIVGWIAICVVVVLPAALVSGYQFPLLIALLGKGDASVGRQVGLAYAWNTFGAIAGSLAGGFALMPALGAVGAWRAVVVVLAALAIGTAAVAFRRGEAARPTAPLAITAAAILCLSAFGPTAAWRHGEIGVGRGPTADSANGLKEWVNGRRRNTLWEVDGVESSVALYAQNANAFVVNGKIDGNAVFDAETQVMSGLTGALFHPGPKKAMVVGLGTGQTAGWMAAISGMERVDVAELEPAILRYAAECAVTNQNVLENPKVKITIGDAREILLTSREKYDIVFSEPSNPYRAGVSGLFTQDFYQAVVPRLEQDGMFLQWLQAYAVDAQTVRSVIATLASVFPHVETWVTKEGDLLLIATLEPLTYDTDLVRVRLGQEPFRTAIGRVWRSSDVEGVFARYMANERLAARLRVLEADAISTDDLTVVEFGFARGVGVQASLFDRNELRALASRLKLDRPERVRGEVDWGLVEERRASMLAAQGKPPSAIHLTLPPEARRRRDALQAWYEGNLAVTLQAWRAQPAPPSDPIQTLVVAEALAEAGDESVVGHIELMRRMGAGEADFVEARLRQRQGRLEEATEAIERGLARLRTDPWIQSVALNHFLELPLRIAPLDHALGERIYRALEAPFAARLFDEVRRGLRYQLAVVLKSKRHCVEAFEPYARHPDWRAPFLEGRWRCYLETSDPRAAAARADLDAFLLDAPTRFDRGFDEAPAPADEHAAAGVP